LDAYTYTFDAAMLANSGALPMVETELYDSGASHHMSPYRHKFIDFIDIEPKTITSADAGTFLAIGRVTCTLRCQTGSQLLEFCFVMSYMRPRWVLP